MTARDTILARLRAQQRDGTSRPDLHQEWTEYDEPVAQFQQVLEAVGGTLFRAADDREAKQLIAELPVLQQARHTVSTVEHLLSGTVDLAGIDDPHDLAPVDLALCEAEFWVAENGAVWVTDEWIKHRVLLFLTQHLILTVPRGEFVPNMHGAYQRVAEMTRPFGVFISGPSKTADIEQSLVIGAHGARSLAVILIG